MPKMSSTDAKVRAAQGLICEIHNPAPDIPLVTLGNTHKEALRSLADIFLKPTSPAVPPRVLVEGSGEPRIKPN